MSTEYWKPNNKPPGKIRNLGRLPTASGPGGGGGGAGGGGGCGGCGGAGHKRIARRGCGGEDSSEPSPLFWLSVDSVDAVANVRRNHFHCLILRQRLESTPLVLQLRQRLDARLLKSHSMKRYTTYTTYTSPPPPHQDVLQLCQRLDAVGCLRWCPWLDQLCGCLSRQQLHQRLEHFFCCLSRQLDHLFCCLSR